MMHFLEPAADGELLAELRDVGLLDPASIGRIEALLGHPETGTLNELLLAGSDVIPEKAWLSWLIRRHGCHRFGRVTWREEALPWVRSGLPEEGNLPYRIGLEGSLLMAILRPDLLPVTLQRWPAPFHRAAATLAELRSLHAAWRRAAPSDHEEFPTRRPSNPETVIG